MDPRYSENPDWVSANEWQISEVMGSLEDRCNLDPSEFGNGIFDDPAKHGLLNVGEVPDWAVVRVHRAIQP
jgi:hypothetical protein